MDIRHEGLGDEIKRLRTALKKIRVESRKSKPDPDKIWKLANDAIENHE